MNKSVIIISLLILLFTTIGCDKDDYELGNPVVEAKQDSLLCRMWLHNVQGDTTNVFREGEEIRIGFYLQSFKEEDVWIPVNLIFKRLGILFYQSNGSYVGAPSGLYIERDRFILLTNQQPMKGTFCNINGLDGLDTGKRLSKGEYYLTLQYKTTLFRIDTTNVNDDEIKGNVIFPQMRFNFKIQ